MLHRKASRHGVWLLTLLFLFTLVHSTPATGQVLYGSLTGTVEDQSGGVVPKATITITNKATGLTREVESDNAGRYSMPNILPGVYDVKISAPGFKTSNIADVEITINNVTRADTRLEVGAVSEQVSVEASAVLLKTDKSDVSHEISSVQVTNLPLPAYRNYQSLLDLVPGATPSAFQNAVVDTPGRALTTNVNGTARNNNNTLVDGAANTFIWLPHHTYYVQPVESIETVNVTTGSFDAEQGMAGGAAITVATKSGSNDIHGVAFWYHNNQHLNSADQYFRSATYRKPLRILNQPGGTFSGPIVKNKLFYFLSYERTMERTGYSGNYSVPPEAFRRGDFSQYLYLTQLYDPATQVGNDPATRKPFVGNIIPANRISPIWQKMQQGIPLPNQVSPTDPNNLSGNYFTSGVLTLDRDMYDAKVNYNATSKIAIWGKYSRMVAPVAGKYPFGDMGGSALGTAGVGDTTLQIPTVGFTYMLTPNFLWDGVFGITRFDQTVTGPNQDTNVGLDVFGIPGTNGGRQYADDPRYGGVPAIYSHGFSEWGNLDTWVPLERKERTYEFRTNFAWIKGAHEIRFGFEARRYQMDHWQPETANPRGQINIAGGTTQIPGQVGFAPNSYAAGLLGNVYSYSKSIQFLPMSTRETPLGWYASDRWKVTRNLTLNLGLRYEYYPLMNRGDRGLENWNPYTNKVTLGGFGNIPWENNYHVSKKLFAPRLGFAYRMGDNWVVRSGYGITIDPLPFSRPLRGLYPSTLTASWDPTFPDAAMKETSFGWYNNLSQGIPNVPTPDLSSGVLDLPLSFDMGPRSPWGGELKRGYIQSWNFTIERRLPWETVANVAYVGTRTIHQLLDRDINTAGPGTGVNQATILASLPLARLYGRTNAATMWDAWAYGSYNGLQTSLQKNFSSGLFFRAAYTWSKTLNFADDDGWAGVRLWNWEPMLARNYAPAGYDRRHMFTMAWMYELPFGHGKRFDIRNGFADAVLGGWKINGTFAKYSGTPFTVTGSSQSIRCARGCSQTADQIAPVRKIDEERGPNKPYYDPMSFRDPLWQWNRDGIFRPGTMGANALYGPGYWRINPSIYKTFRITERVNTEFRVESFNFTNTPQWGNPNAGSASLRLDPNTGALQNIANPLQNFMSITSASTGRQFRFGLRLAF